MTAYTDLVASITKQYPNFSIVYKSNSLFMKIINALLFVLSFGQMNTFMSNFITTIGSTVYVPSSWDSFSDISKIIILRHENIHLGQAAKEGQLLFSLKYLFWYFPMFFAWGRTVLEMEAYKESIIATIENEGVSAVQNDSFKSWLISNFTSSSYLWMWYDSNYITNWVNKTIDDCISTYNKTNK